MSRSHRIIVRPMRQDEAAVFLGIHGRSVRGLAHTHYDADVLDAWAAHVSDERLHAFLANRDGEIRLVAEIDGTPVGIGALILESAHVPACYVVPEAARRGVATALMREIERIARAHGLTHLSLLASLNAEPFYRAVGYQSDGPTEHTLRTGRQMAAVRMSKHLTPDS